MHDLDVVMNSDGRVTFPSAARDWLGIQMDKDADLQLGLKTECHVYLSAVEGGILVRTVRWRVEQAQQQIADV